MEIKDYETLLKQAYQTAPIGLCLFDTELRYRHINEWLASINGHSVEEHLGRTIDEVIPNVLEGVELILRRVMETREPVLNSVVEAESKDLQHHMRFFQHSYHTVKSDEGTVLGVSCIIQDITDRKRTEEALCESEERYLSLSEASFEGLMIHDRGRVIDANTRIQEMFGYSLEELIKMSAFELVAPEDRDLVRQNVAEGYEGSYEAVGLRKDSSTFPMELQARHTHYCGRRVRVVACQDITVRKQAEEALRESEKRYLSLSEASFEGLLIHDRGKILDANRRIQEMFGYRFEELTKMIDYELIAPEEREKVRQNVAEGKEGSYEAVGLRKDSTTFPMELQARHMQYRGRHVRVVACQDITTRKQAEKLQSDQRRILELISLDRVSQTEVFETITKVAEDHMPGVRSTILLLENNTLRHGAAPSMPKAYNEMIDGIQIGPSVGSCGTAAYRKTRVVVEDIRSDPLWVDFRHLGEEYGFRACWSQPILDPHENVLGTFALYYELPGSPTDTEIHFIESMAHLAGIAIERNRAKKTLIDRSETERLMLRELDHRVRNNLASLISLIDLSRSDADRCGSVRRVDQGPRSNYRERALRTLPHEVACNRIAIITEHIDGYRRRWPHQVRRSCGDHSP